MKGGAPPKKMRRCGLTQPNGSTQARTCLRCARSLSTLAQHTDITIGSDCAGLCAEAVALELLGIKHKHAFASELNRDVRHLLYQTYGRRTQMYYRDVTRRNHDEAPGVDLYVFGAPCQPFSPAGLGSGFGDPRSSAFLSCIAYIRAKLPKCFVCENSHRLLSQRYTGTWKPLKKQLRALNYSIRAGFLDTKTQGIPQSRPRSYIVGIRRDVATMKFKFPIAIEPEAVEHFLDDGLTSSAKCPHGPRVEAALARAADVFKKKSVDPSAQTCFVDTGASPKWSSAMIGISPCLTATRCSQGGHYITSKCRMMTMSEMCRLQGFPPDRFDYHGAGISKSKFARAVGNAMSVNVLQRLLPGVLEAAGLLTPSGGSLPKRFSHHLRSNCAD